MVCWGFPQPSATSRQHYPGLLLPGSNSRQPLCQAWGSRSISQPWPSEVRLYLSRQPKHVAAGTLVPQLLVQPSCLILVVKSPEPRQGFAKNIRGVQPVQEPAQGCTSPPTPRRTMFMSRFLVPSAVAMAEQPQLPGIFYRTT